MRRTPLFVSAVVIASSVGFIFLYQEGALIGQTIDDRDLPYCASADGYSETCKSPPICDLRGGPDSPNYKGDEYCEEVRGKGSGCVHRTSSYNSIDYYQCTESDEERDAFNRNNPPPTPPVIPPPDPEQVRREEDWEISLRPFARAGSYTIVVTNNSETLHYPEDFPSSYDLQVRQNLPTSTSVLHDNGIFEHTMPSGFTEIHKMNNEDVTMTVESNQDGDPYINMEFAPKQSGKKANISANGGAFELTYTLDTPTLVPVMDPQDGPSTSDVCIPFGEGSGDPTADVVHVVFLFNGNPENYETFKAYTEDAVYGGAPVQYGGEEAVYEGGNGSDTVYHEATLYGAGGEKDSAVLEEPTKTVGLLGYEPFLENKKKMQFWRHPQVVPLKGQGGVCPDACNSPARCSNVPIAFYSNACDVDCRSAVTTDDHVSYIAMQAESPERVFVHEFGHQFGQLADEYGEAGRPDNPREPNCAPTEEIGKSWWKDVPGYSYVGNYAEPGCSYVSNNVRPINYTMMKDHMDSESDAPDGFKVVNTWWMSNLLDLYTGNSSIVTNSPIPLNDELATIGEQGLKLTLTRNDDGSYSVTSQEPVVVEHGVKPTFDTDGQAISITAGDATFTQTTTDTSTTIIENFGEEGASYNDIQDEPLEEISVVVGVGDAKIEGNELVFPDGSRHKLEIDVSSCANSDANTTNDCPPPMANGHIIEGFEHRAADQSITSASGSTSIDTSIDANDENVEDTTSATLLGLKISTIIFIGLGALIFGLILGFVLLRRKNTPQSTDQSI